MFIYTVRLKIYIYICSNRYILYKTGNIVLCAFFNVMQKIFFNIRKLSININNKIDKYNRLYLIK